MYAGLRTILVTLFAILHLLPVNALEITIDDTNGDPRTGAKPFFSPAGAWRGSDCGSCNPGLDASRAEQGTYHESLYSPDSGLGGVSITVPFEGVLRSLVDGLCGEGKDLNGFETNW